jgi:hypothetical protein
MFALRVKIKGENKKRFFLIMFFLNSLSQLKRKIITTIISSKGLEEKK